MKLEQTYQDIAAYGEKYHFYYHAENQTVVCTTMYKGKMVRGIAKCNQEDTFDIDVGKNLAYLRCRQKFMRKKLRRAHDAVENASVAMERAKWNFIQAHEFLSDSQEQLFVATNELTEFESKLN